MRSDTLRAAVLVFVSTFVAASFGACGGSTTSDLFGGATDGGAGGGDASSSDGASGDAGGGGDGGVGGDGGSDGGGGDARVDAPVQSCDDLRKQVDDLRPAAIECLTTTDVMQCDSQIDDICCKATVDKVSRSGKAVKDFQAAVAAFRAANCVAGCPATPCRDTPSFTCLPNGLGASCFQ